MQAESPAALEPVEAVGAALGNKALSAEVGVWQSQDIQVNLGQEGLSNLSAVYTVYSPTEALFCDNKMKCKGRQKHGNIERQ